MRKKFKLKLINNYVDIYKILYNSKELLKSTKDTTLSEKLICILDDTINLKKNYEKIFESLHIIDTSFLVLKRDLESALKLQAPQSYNPASLENILKLKSKAEKDLLDASLSTR